MAKESWENITSKNNRKIFNMRQQENQAVRKVWYWIKIITLLTGLICGSILIYRWWDRKQKLERLQVQLEQKERENQQNYQDQKII